MFPHHLSKSTRSLGKGGCIAKNQNKTDFEEGFSVSIPLELFRKFIRFGDATRP